MKHIESFKFFKVWLYSLLGYVVFMIAYLMITGRVLDEVILGEVVTILGMIVLVSSVIVAVGEIIYAIVKKTYEKILIGVGILGLSFVLFILLVVMAIASVWG